MPTLLEMETRRDHLLTVWRRAHQEFREKEEFANLTFPVWPDNETANFYHPGRAAAVIHHAVDNVMSTEPRFHRERMSDRQEAQENADRIENWLRASFKAMSLAEPTPTNKQLARYLNVLGYAVAEGIVMDSGLPKPEDPPTVPGDNERLRRVRERIFEHEKKTWFPFRFRAPHPSTILLDPAEKVPTIAIKHAPVHAHKLRAWTQSMVDDEQFDGFERRVFQHDDAHPFEEVMITEWWDRDWHALAANNELLFSVPNVGHYVPYSHIFSGWGNVTSDNHDPAVLCHGFLDDEMESLRIDAQRASLQHQFLHAAVKKYIGTTGDAEELRDQLADLDNEGVVNVPGGPESVFPLDTNRLDSNIFNIDNQVQRDLEFGLFPPAVVGIREAGVITVGQQAILSTSAMRRFVMPQMQLEHLYTVMAMKLLQLLDIVGETIWVDGKSLSPSNLDGDYTVEVSFRQFDPVLAIQERQTALAEHAQRLISNVDYWAVAGKEDATGIMERIIEEDIMRLPQVQMQLQNEVMRRWGLQAAPSGLVGADGQPISSEGNEPTQPLTPGIANPPRTGAAFAGADLNASI